MIRPINLKDYKEELDYIRQERANINLREISVCKKIRELFNSEVKDFLNGGFRVIKIEKDDHKTIYGIVDRIEFANWNNGKKIMSSSVNLYGLFLYCDSTHDFYAATNISCFDDSMVFTIIDEMQDITLSELNEKITAWYIKCNEDYLTGGEEFEPMPNWFIEENYKIYFEKYKDILNNEFLNKEFEKKDTNL